MTQSKSGQFFKSAILFTLLMCLSAINFPAQSQGKIPPKKFKISEESFELQLGETAVKIVVSKTSERPSKFAYFNVHNNENTSVEAAKNIIEKHGGTLIELRNDNKRLISFMLKDKKFTADPNRMFTVAGINKTLEDNGEYSIEAEKEIIKFAAKLKDFLKKFQLIIAVHNNTDENYSIKSYTKGEIYGSDAKFVSFDSETDADDFFFVTEKNFLAYLIKKKQNVVLQDNENVTDDGSLSVYCGKNKILYLNVESQHGHLKEQIKMLEILQKPVSDFSRSKVKNRRGQKK